MSIVGSNPGVNHKDLATAVATAASVATTALKPLLAERLILNRRDREDSRSTTYRLSKRGSTLLHRLNQRLTLASRQLEAPLSKKEAEELRKLLTKLLGATSET